MTAKVDGIEVAAGNSKLMDKLGVKWIDCHQAGTIVHMAVGGTYAGHIVISDVEKPHAKEAIRALRSAGIEKTVMLTGDSWKVAEHVAADLGIDEVYAELLPGDKVAKVEELLEQKMERGKLAFVGDGTMVVNAILMCLLDYVLAYTLLGLGGIFRDKIANRGVALMAGSLVALGARYVAHILSGYILFASYAEWFFTQEGFPAWGAQLVQTMSPSALGLLYSVVYNGMYMVPEMILTAVVAVLIARVPKIVTKVS